MKYSNIDLVRGDDCFIPVVVDIPSGSTNIIQLRENTESANYFTLEIIDNKIFIPSSISINLSGHYELEIESNLDGVTTTLQHTTINFIADVTRLYGDIAPILNQDLEREKIIAKDFLLRDENGNLIHFGIQGEQGIKGDTGAKGDTGIQGTKGDTGLQGIQGIKGDTGLQGIQGIQGLSGATGLQGIQGLTGAAGAFGIAGTFSASMPVSPVTDKVYAYTGVDSTVINSITWKNGDNAYYNGSVWVRIPFQSLANYYAKSDFNFKSGKNKFDKSIITTGYYINGANGVVTTAAGYSITDYIPVLSNTNYTISGFGTLHYGIGIAFYSGTTLLSGSYIMGSDITYGVILTPANCTNIRFTLKTGKSGDNTSVDSIQVEDGSVITTYEAYYKMFYNVGGNNLYSVTPDDFTYSVGKNKFDKSIVTGYYINGATGAVTLAAGYSISGYIPVLANTYYYFSGFGSVHYGVGIAFYNGTTLLSGSFAVGIDINDGYILTPSNCNNIKFTVKTGAVGDTININNIQVEEGLIPTTYEAYYRYVSQIKNINTGLNTQTITPVTSGKNALIFGDSITSTDNANVAVWVTNAVKIMGITYNNYARTGASFCDWSTSDLRQMLSNQISEAIAANLTPDIIIISLGTNDYVRTLGDYNTTMNKTLITDLDRTIVLDAVRFAFWKLKIQYPTAKCFYANPLQTCGNGDEANDNGGIMRSNIERIAKRYGWLIIDQYGKSGVVKDFEINGSNGRYLKDGLHPNENGIDLQSKFIAHEIIKEYIN